MKTLIIILTIFFMAMTEIVAQVNPLGLYIDIDGSIKFWTTEANRNGQVDDSVYITLNGEKNLCDLRNLKYDYLTILEAPRANWTTPSNLDPSRINDTSRYYDSKNIIGSFIPFFLIPTNSVKEFTLIVQDTLHPIKKQDYFVDDIRGDGLNDSIVNLVKAKLNDFTNLFYGKFLPDLAINQLRTEISYHDTVIDKIAIYDYLVDLMVTYNYDGNDRLTKVIGYHWDQGVEVDSLKYDKLGNLIYFSREHIGTNRNECFFEYDKFGRVSAVVVYYNSVGRNVEEFSFANTDFYKMKFTYNNSGIMNSKSDLQEGKWLTCYFEIK